MEIDTSINIPSSDEALGFYTSVRDGDVEAVLAQLAEKVIDPKENEGSVALMVACQEGHSQIAEILLERGAEVNTRTQDGRTPLFKAVDEGHLETCRVLLAHGADINAKTNNGVTPLMRAALGHKDILEFLIANGADVAAKTKFGETALYYAAVEKHKDIISILRKSGAKK